MARIGQATDFDTKSKFDTKTAHVNFSSTSPEIPRLMYPKPAPLFGERKNGRKYVRKMEIVGLLRSRLGAAQKS